MCRPSWVHNKIIPWKPHRTVKHGASRSVMVSNGKAPCVSLRYGSERPYDGGWKYIQNSQGGWRKGYLTRVKVPVRQFDPPRHGSRAFPKSLTFNPWGWWRIRHPDVSPWFDSTGLRKGHRLGWFRGPSLRGEISPWPM
jgi:hypothetical protein